MEERLRQATRLLDARSPEELVKRNGQTLEYLVKSLIDAQTRRLDRLEQKLAYAAQGLSRLNPASLMSRGYTITMGDGHAMTSASQAVPGKSITTIFSDGEVFSTVISYEKKEEAFQ